MTLQRVQPAATPTKKTIRNVLQLGWTASGTRALEAVREEEGETENAYFQVTHVGKEILQTVSRSEAQQCYDGLGQPFLNPLTPRP